MMELTTIVSLLREAAEVMDMHPDKTNLRPDLIQACAEAAQRLAMLEGAMDPQRVKRIYAGHGRREAGVAE